MKSRSYFVHLSCAVLLAGCASAPTGMHATGGSKADGVVEMSYEYSEFQQPVVNYEE